MRDPSASIQGMLGADGTALYRLCW